MFTWITKDSGKVGRVQQTHADAAPGPEWYKVPNDWGGNPGDDLTWFDAGMRRIPDYDLIALGTRSDNRGTWYNKEKIGETKLVYELDEEPGEGWTRKTPLENEAFQEWDDAADAWVIDEPKKEQARIRGEIGEAQSELSAGDYKVTKAAEKGLTLEELYPGETAKRDALRAKINTLEAQLAE
jgi:hypothetical protein